MNVFDAYKTQEYRKMRSCLYLKLDNTTEKLKIFKVTLWRTLLKKSYNKHHCERKDIWTAAKTVSLKRLKGQYIPLSTCIHTYIDKEDAFFIYFLPASFAVFPFFGVWAKRKTSRPPQGPNISGFSISDLFFWIWNFGWDGGALVRNVTSQNEGSGFYPWPAQPIFSVHGFSTNESW